MHADGTTVTCGPSTSGSNKYYYLFFFDWMIIHSGGPAGSEKKKKAKTIIFLLRARGVLNLNIPSSAKRSWRGATRHPTGTRGGCPRYTGPPRVPYICGPTSAANMIPHNGIPQRNDWSHRTPAAICRRIIFIDVIPDPSS